jgi:hypothetical protein
MDAHSNHQISRSHWFARPEAEHLPEKLWNRSRLYPDFANLTAAMHHTKHQARLPVGL